MNSYLFVMLQFAESLTLVSSRTFSPSPQEAEEFADQDKAVKAKIDARNSLETFCYNMKSTVEDKLKEKVRATICHVFFSIRSVVQDSTAMTTGTHLSCTD